MNTEKYILIDGETWGPFNEEDLAEIQATAKRPYEVVEVGEQQDRL